jgi:hypothetical protein
MVEFLDMNVQHVQSEAATGLTLMIRKLPELKPVCSASLCRTLRYVQEPSGKASIIWLLGECCDIVQDAPYALEKLIDNYDNIKDLQIKQNLLNATMKMFFARPPEVQRMLGRLLLKVTDDVSSQDLHDRGLLYYRLLKSGADPSAILSHVVNTKSVISGSAVFTEDDDQQLRNELMLEFNSLATVYGRSSINFIRPEFQVVYKKMPPEHPLDGGGMAPADTDAGVPVAPQALPQPAVDTSAPAPPPDNMIGDLLGFDSPVPAPAPPPTSIPLGGLSLMAGVTMPPEDYQAKWGAIADADSMVEMVPIRSIPASTDVVEAALSTVQINTMASGELPNEFKFFLYAQENGVTGSTFLIQSNISKDSEAAMILTVKVHNPMEMSNPQVDQQKVTQLAQLVQSALG